jgi:2-oxoglutarate dehydrogenase E1 component
MTLEDFHGPNIGYILELYDRFREDPNAVDETTRNFFEHWSPAKTENTAQTGTDLRAVIGAVNLAYAIRSHGYVSARLDPLGSPPMQDPSLTLESHQLREEDLFALPAEIVNLPDGQGGANAHQAIEKLRSIYSNTIG